MPLDRKTLLRSELLAARRAMTDAARQAEMDQLCGHLPELLDGVDTVCAYVPMGTEPGAPGCLDALARLSPTVFLPLQWGRYGAGELIKGPFGAREPRAPWLPDSAVANAAVVLVPAVAVDRRGVRLGRGGGFYDRTLALCRPDARIVAVVRDSEMFDELPAEPHDVPVTHALTPGGGLIRLSGMPRRR